MTDRPAKTQGKTRLAEMEARVAPLLTRSAWLSLSASLVWPVQAALVAWVLAGLLAPEPIAMGAVWAAAAGLVALAGLKAAAQHQGGRLAFDAADRVLAAERAALILAEARRAPGKAPVASAAVAAMASEKLAALVPYLTRYRAASLRARIVPIAFFALALSMSWVAALVFLIAGPLIPVFMALVGMAAKEASEKQMVEIGALNTLLMDRLSALVDIRLLDAGDRTQTDFRTRADTLKDKTMAVLRVAFLSSTVLELFAALGVALVAVYVGFALIGEITFGAWGTPLTPIEGIALLLIAPEFFQPLRDLAAAWHDKAAAEAVADEVSALPGLTGESALVGQGASAVALPGVASIRAEGLAARLPDGRMLPYPDFDIAPGARVAITGPSGVGKTTLLTLIAGLGAPASGRLVVAGVDLGPDTADGWRARLGWVPQAPRFPAGRLADGIALGRAGDMDAALAAARADHVVAALPQGLETELGETGGGVSGGEARRLVLARAHLAGADVILADEPTADLDAETAQAVIDGLLALADTGASLVVATHDPRLVAALDTEIPLSVEQAA